MMEQQTDLRIEEMIRYEKRILKLSPPKNLDCVFVFGRADEDWQPTEGDSGILEKAADLCHQEKCDSISFPGTDAGQTVSGKYNPHTYPGMEAWYGYLEKLLHVPADKLIPTKPANPPHTRGESDAFVELAKRKGWDAVGILGHWYQDLRGLLSVLKSMELGGHTMRVYPITPDKTVMEKLTFGSQGNELTPRTAQRDKERVNILTYQDNGDLASFEELEIYLSKITTTRNESRKL